MYRYHGSTGVSPVLANAKGNSISNLSTVVVVGKPVNHLLHFLVTVFTFGIWGLVWLLLVLTGGERREMVRIDENGSVIIERLIP